jgi:hypothetical protein
MVGARLIRQLKRKKPPESALRQLQRLVDAGLVRDPKRFRDKL